MGYALSSRFTIPVNTGLQYAYAVDYDKMQRVTSGTKKTLGSRDAFSFLLYRLLQQLQSSTSVVASVYASSQKDAFITRSAYFLTTRVPRVTRCLYSLMKYSTARCLRLIMFPAHTRTVLACAKSAHLVR